MTERKILVLCVCGSGAVSSSILAQKIKAILSGVKIKSNVIELLPASVEAYMTQGEIDFIVTTGPIPGKIHAPVIEGFNLLTGIGEDAVAREVLSTAQEIIDKA